MSSSVIQSFAKSSVGMKQVMAATGLALCGFLGTHLLGNLLVLLGPDTFNMYAYKLTSNPLIYLAEAILVIIFLSHIVMAVKLTIQNKLARPVGYLMRTPTGRGSTFASATMPYTGLIILVFLVTHLISFKYGAYYSATVDGQEVRDVYRVVVEYFANQMYVAWYVIAMIATGIHVSHGLWSAIQSFGFNHPKYNCSIKLISKLYGVVIAFGYSALAIFCHFKGA
jgi:succinate dehydrogenase / fumarate reductase, cytochrome b subunit